MNMKSWMMFGIIAAMAAAQAMTYSEFKEAVTAAQDGGMVVLENDVMYDSALPSISKRITITSPAGATNTLLRASSYTGLLLTMGDASADITLSRIAFDGNKAAGRTGRAISMTAGRLTLGAGAAIRNFDFGYNSGGIYVATDGVFVMDEGSEISGCDYGYGAHFAMILLGNRSAQLAAGEPDGVFEMNGGLITGNAGHSSQTTGDYDGVIYLYSYEQNNCVLRLNGGLITGNTSDSSCAGICTICGTVYIGGDSCVTGNVGGVVNDIYNSRSDIYVADGYRGRTTIVPRGTPVDGRTAEKMQKLTDSPEIGAGNISAQVNPTLVLGGYYDGTGLYWQKAIGTADGVFRCGQKEELVAAVTNGGCICIERDQVLNGVRIPNGKSVTVRSGPGERWTLSRASTAQFFVALTNATLRFEEVILDGCGMEGMIFGIAPDATIILGDGAEVCNGYHTTGPGIASLTVNGAKFVMEEGSVIRDCVATSAGGYGALLRIGNNTTFETPPRLEMSGGLITNCTSAATGAASGGYGGMIYVQKGVFEMTGGKIAGNVCEGSCAGVQHYQGTIRLSGKARIENNPGAAPDLYKSGGSSYQLSVFGDFRGHVGISSGNQGVGQESPITIATGATGAWGFFPAANGSDRTLVGTPNAAETKVSWTAATGWIDGDGVASAADAQTAWGAVTLTLDERGIAALPHTFAGSALGVDSAVSLVFDPEGFKSSPLLPLRLVAAEGGSLSGTWSFNMPQPRRGRWYVMPVFAGGGVSAYELRFSPPGMKVMIR